MVESVIERILVVDDEDSYRVLLLEFLKRLGYICRGATDAFEALERLGEEQYDLVISDIVMKGRNGVELTREARRLYPDTDFLIMTGHSKEYSYLDIIEAGASDYILKPFDSAEVKAKIARIAREKQAIRRLSSMNESISWELALNSAITDLAKAHLDTHESEKLSSLLLEHAMNLTLSSMGCIRHFDIKHAQSFCSNGPGHFCEKFPDEDAGRYVNPSERLWDLCRNELEPVFFNLDQQAAEGSELAIFRFISVPIAFDGSIVGRIILANSNRDYTAKDLSALTHLTSVYALMIKNIQINAEMKRTKDHLEAIFDGSPAAIGIIDRSWTPIKWNKGATELFGYTGDELSEIKVHELYADKDSLNKMLARLHRDGFVRRYEIEMRRKDGRIAPA